jgi:hypothetical protein
MQTRTENRRRHNSKTYRSFIFRVRKGSELETRLDEYMAESLYSLNFLLTALLCSKLGCKLPHREYTITKKDRIL